MIPDPRPPKGHDRPSVGRGPGRALRPARPVALGDVAGLSPCHESSPTAEPPLVALTRSNQGWTVVSPAGADDVADLVEGLSLADLVAEEFGVLVEPDRTARRSARGPADGAVDPDSIVDARVAALERTVAQLEHALAARVSTERAIGVLAERHGTSMRTAFEELRRDARSQGRPVAELAREVLDGLTADEPAVEPGGTVPPVPRESSEPAAVPAASADTAS